MANNVESSANHPFSLLMYFGDYQNVTLACCPCGRLELCVLGPPGEFAAIFVLRSTHRFHTACSYTFLHIPWFVRDSGVTNVATPYFLISPEMVNIYCHSQ